VILPTIPLPGEVAEGDAWVQVDACFFISCVQERAVHLQSPCPLLHLANYFYWKLGVGNFLRLGEGRCWHLCMPPRPSPYAHDLARARGWPTGRAPVLR
jgi:hypothetical protein